MDVLTFLHVPKSQGSPDPAVGKLDASTRLGLEELRNRELPRAYVVREEDLAALVRYTRLIADLGEKKERVELWRCLKKVKDGRFPIIRGKYRALPQLKRSIYTVLRHAAAAGRRTVYFVGIGDQIFARLWKQAQEGRPAAMPRIDVDHLEDDKVLASLSKVMHRQEVPAGLCEELIGVSPEIAAVRQLILRAAEHRNPVLLLGESGTGKEIAARWIHKMTEPVGPRSEFCAINCGAIPLFLFESELFGHKKGAFTDATYDRKGAWERAGGGTLFLDEIGDMTLDHQVKVHRALDSGRVLPVGGQRETTVQARVIAATNRDLYTMLGKGLFREDLFYRLRIFQIATPPLRDRAEDIPVLAQHFWSRVAGPLAPPLGKTALDVLQMHRWPGNARELRSVLEGVHSWFGASKITRDQVSLVMRFYGLQTCPAEDIAEKDSLAFHHIDCLQHLRRTDELVRALKVTLRPVSQAETCDARMLQGLPAVVAERIAEFDQICARPVLFYSPAVFDTVYQLKGRLMSLLELIEGGKPQAVRRYYRQELKPHINLATHTLIQEVERLVRDHQQGHRAAPFRQELAGDSPNARGRAARKRQ